MSVEKVTLPREVAEAIESVYECSNHHHRHFQNHKAEYLTDWSNLEKFYHRQYEVLRTFFLMNPVNYMQALVNGYDVEQTPEDIVLGFWDRADACIGNVDAATAYRLGMKDFARVHNIAIEWKEVDA